MITQEYLKSILNYDPETGLFTWLVQKGKRVKIGQKAGIISEGYIKIKIDGKKYFAHRLAWLYMTGEWPKDEIDHKNTIRGDNRWENLREATSQQNSFNISIRVNNKSGFKGVYKYKHYGYRAAINFNGKITMLGLFATAKEAHEAYVKAAKEIFGEFFRE